MKLYIYKKIIFAALVLGILCFWSCLSDSEFLKEVPETDYTLDNVFSTSAQVEASVTTLYAHVRTIETRDENSLKLLKGNGTDIFDVPSFRIADALSDYTKLNAENSLIYDAFNNWYLLGARANLSIYGAELEHINWSSEDAKAYVIAQAKFFRGYTYLNLGELFGGVPIVEDLVIEPRYDFARSTRIETYSFAIQNLEEALPDLPETTPIAGRIVKGAAYHCLAQAYLGMGIEMEQKGEGDYNAAYNKSVEYASKVIDGSIYKLMTERFGTRKDEPDRSAYWDMFQVGNIDFQNGNTECIWAFQVDYKAYRNEDKSSFLPYPRVFGPVYRDMVGIDANGNPFKPFMTNAWLENGGRGIALVAPTLYVRDYIWENKYNDDIRNAPHNIKREILCNNPDLPDMYGKPIPESILNQDDRTITIAFPIWMKLTTDEFEGIAEGQNHSNLFRDDYAIRLAETILLRTEAYYRLGQTTKASNDINMLRDRAKCTYKVSAGDVSLNLILDERARELFGEEKRWNTLLRMGGSVATDRIKKYAYWTDLVKSTLTFDYNLWPIPQQAIDRNKDVKIEQNPGWRK